MKLTELTHTYSIIAYDPINNQLGAAMQTHNFAACNGVVWLEPGVGAAASQAMSDPFYAFACFDLIKLGVPADKALQATINLDVEYAKNRQIGIVDIKGNAAAFTGENCIEKAGHRIGKNYTCQANIMLKNTVWNAMGFAYENCEGELIDRLIKAMEAAEKESGDIRGRQSAVIKVTSAEPKIKPWENRYIYDFRVYDSREPLAELKHLIKLNRLYENARNTHNLLHEINIEDEKVLNEAIDSFIEVTDQIPNLDSKLEHQLYYAFTLITKHKEKNAEVILNRLFKIDSVWKEIAMRFAKSNPERFNMNFIKELISRKIYN